MMPEEYHKVDLEDHKDSGGQDCEAHNHACCVPQLDNEDDLEFKKKLKNLEQEWYLETVEQYKTMPWYRTPNNIVLFVVVSFYTLSFTVLVSPLVILMLNNFCTSKTSDASADAAVTAMTMTTTAITETATVLAKTTKTLMSTEDMGGVVKSSSRLFKRMAMEMVGAGSICKGNKDAQKTVSNIQSILAAVAGLLGFLLSSKFGQYSDCYGRVFIFRLFNVINTLNSVFVILYFEVIKKYNMLLMVVFLSVGYFSGGVMTLISAAAGYVSDIEDKKNRSVSISVLMSVIYLALGVGPLLSSFIVKITGSNVVILWVSLGMSIFSTIITFTLLVESKNPKSLALANERYRQKYASGSFQFINTITSFFKPMKRLWLPKTANGSVIPRINVLTLILVDIAQMSSCVGTMHVLVLYCVLKFNWSSVQIGYYMSLIGFGKAFVLLAVAPSIHNILVSRFNYRVNTQSVDGVDRFLIMVSMIFIFLSILLLVVTDNSYVVYASAILQSLGGMISPIIQSAIVKFSANTESGELFGVIAVTRHLQMLLLPVFFLQIYSATVDSFPKLFLLLPLVGSGICCIISYFGLTTSNEMTNADIELEFTEGAK